MTSSKYVGMDAHKEHADFLIIPTTNRRPWLGGPAWQSLDIH
jgi:hypothetical protein